MVPLALALGIGLHTRRHLAGSADFMSGGRLAARHPLAVGRGELFAGAVMFVASFAVILKSGFVVAGWWRWSEVPAPLLVAMLPVAFSWSPINDGWRRVRRLLGSLLGLPL